MAGLEPRKGSGWMGYPALFWGLIAAGPLPGGAIYRK
jgi:hypothetical protein